MLAALVPLLLLAAAAPPALPAPCGGSCGVDGSGITGFVPPVLLLRSGSEVVWRGLDHAAHVNLEGAFNFDAAASCFVATYAGAQAARVTFRLEGGRLVAEQGGVAKACASAVVAEGTATLGYQCVLHAATMKGALVVVA